MLICKKKLKKVYHFKMAVILLFFLSRDCAIPRKLKKKKKKHFPEDVFQRTLAQSSRSSIENITETKYCCFCYSGWILQAKKYFNAYQTMLIS